eukprot:Sdes_comp15980_c0_seq2m5136
MATLHEENICSNDPSLIDLSDGTGKLIKKILKQGEGAIPEAGDKCFVHYIGRLPSGEVFDSSCTQVDSESSLEGTESQDSLEGAPFEFRLGEGQVIRGWDDGILSMKVGEVAELHCHPEYAYGDAGAPPKIPPGATLIFQVRLVGFEEGLSRPEKRIANVEQRKLKGNALLKNAEYDMAAMEYLEAIDVLEEMDHNELNQPNAFNLRISLYTNCSLALLKDAKLSRCIQICKKGLKFAPSNPKLLYRLGVAYMESHESSLAIQSLLDAAKASPE